MFDDDDPSYVMVHLANIGMHAEPGEFWIEPHGWFLLYEDGELFGVSERVTRRGVTFDAGVELRYGVEDVTRWYLGDNVATQPPILVHPPGPMTGWRGDISAPLTCDGGRIIEIRSRVTVPVTGNIVTTTHWDSSKPKARAILDSYRCDLSPS